MNDELREIYEQDQADRRGVTVLPPSIKERDEARRLRVEAMLAEGMVQTPEDFFHAAMVFQHGGNGETVWKAYELAKIASEMGYERARWLTAAAYDRWLLYQGKPQKYGTQYTRGGRCWKLWTVDPATTDEERAEWNVPSLEQALQRASDMTCE